MEEELIRSGQNERVKEWAALHRGKERRRRGVFLAEGPHLVGEALAAGVRIEVLIYDPDDRSPEVATLVDRARRRGLVLQPVSRAVMDKICESATPQGIAAVVAMPAWRSPSSARAPEGQAAGVLMIALDGVQDPGNVGAVLRVARAVGASGVLCGGDTADPFSPKAVRGSMGAVFSVPIWSGRLTDMLPAWKGKGARLVETGAANGVRYDHWDWRPPTVVVLGSEGRGIRPEIRRLCDGTVHIPMPGGGESLNVAVAAAILLYEAWRQREKSLGHKNAPGPTE
ncbi:MAG: RNA methyltransferase [Kyrpidia sp.]|nr:RNA methyltransferase [Kyrpidia sp.]